MNQVFKVVRCLSTGVFKAVPEFAKSGKKSKSIAISASILSAGIVMASPAIADSAVGDPILAGQATGANAIAIGETTTVTGNESFGAGSENKLEGNNATVVGNNNEATGDNHTALGVNNIITSAVDPYENDAPLIPTQLSTAIGAQNELSGSYSSAYGFANSADGDYNTVIGNTNRIRAKYDDWSGRFIPNSYSTAVGAGNDSDSERTVTVGNFNRAYANEATVVGGDNGVSAERSGAYGRNNNVSYIDNGFSNEVFRAVSSEARAGLYPDRYVQRGSYAYGNSNDVYGDKSHAVGNSNTVNGDKNGLLGNGNELTNNGGIGGGILVPTRMALQENQLVDINDGVITNNDGVITNSDGVIINAPMAVNVNPVGSFLMGNQNTVNADNTHAVGNNNEILNDNNVTLGSSNTVNYLENDNGGDLPPIIDVPQQRAAAGGFLVGNPSTAIVGDGNELRAGGVHIVGTENYVDQQNAYVVGGNNMVEDQSDPLINSPFNVQDGSNVLGSNNRVSSKGSTVSGNNNYVDINSEFNTIAGSQNRASGVATSLVGTSNEVIKDMGGTFGTGNRVIGNTGFADALADSVNSDGEFLGIDIDGDGVVDYTNPEEAQQALIISGSYAYGNFNEVKGESSQVVGNASQVIGDNSGSFGSKNRLGTAAFFEGNSDAITPAVNADNSFAYGNENTITKDGVQVVGNSNTVERSYSAAIGSSNTLTESLNGELIDATEDDLKRIGTFAYGNNNEVASNGGHVTGNNNQFQADDATAAGNDNLVIGDQGHVVGNANKSIGESNKIFGNQNTAGLDMNGDYSSRNSVMIMGDYNQVSGNNSTAIGDNNNVSGRGALAAGSQNTVDSDSAYVLGEQNTVLNSENSNVIGNQNYIEDAEEATVLGNYNGTQSSFSTLVGNLNSVRDDYSDEVVGIGQNNNLSGNQATAIGSLNTIEKDASGAIGVRNSVSAGYQSQGLVGQGLDGLSDAIDYNEYIERGSYAQGNKNVIEGDTTHVYGYQNTVRGNETTALGANNIVSGNQSQVIGNENVVGYNNDGMPQRGDSAGVVGSNNNVQANNSFVVGNNSNVNRDADGSLVLGSNASSIVANGIAIGNNSVADRANSVSVGSAGAERQIINVADATEDKDAVNLGQVSAIDDRLTAENVKQDTLITTNKTNITRNTSTIGNVGSSVVNSFGGNAAQNADGTITYTDIGGTGQDTLDGAIAAANNSIKSVDGDDNITVATDDANNVTVALNKELNVDSITTGENVLNGNGLQVGTVVIDKTTGINAGNQTVSGVANAVNADDAVNLGQVSAIDDRLTAENVIQNTNITRNTSTIGNLGSSVVGNFGGNAAQDADGTITYTDIGGTGQDTLDGAIAAANNGVKSVTGDENITATTDEKNGVIVALNKDLTAESITTGENVLNGSGLQVGTVVIDKTTGINAGNQTVSGVANAVNADDAVNLGQVSAIDDRLTAENVKQDTLITTNKTSITRNTSTIGNVGSSVVGNFGGNAAQADDGTITYTDIGGTGQDTLDGAIAAANNGVKSVTGDENITATTDDKNGVIVALNKDITAESITTGENVLNGSGLQVGTVVIDKTTGINAGNQTVSGVANAVNADDAVNLGQVSAIDDRLTAENVKQDTLITTNKTNITRNTTIIGNVGDSVVGNFGGNAAQDADGTITYTNIGGTGQDTLDGAIAAANNSIKSVDGDDNITVATDDANNVTVALNKELNVDSITTGENVLNGSGLQVGTVVIDKTTGINAGNQTVSGVANAVNADDAVNLGQVSAIDDRLTAENVKQDTLITTNKTNITRNTTTIGNVGSSVVKSFGGNAAQDADGAITYTDIGGTGQDTLDGAIAAANNSIKSVDGDDNITVATDDANNVTVALNKDLNIDNVITGVTTVNTDGVRTGNVFLSSTTGLDNAGNRVTHVGDAIERSDAVNFGQFTDGLNGLTKTTVDGDQNVIATKNATGYDLSLSKNLVSDSLTTGATSVSTDGIKAGNVSLSSTTGLDNAGNRVTRVGDAVESTDAVNLKQLNASIRDTKGGKNITATLTDNGYEISLNDSVDLTNLTAGATSVSTDGIKAGDVFLSSATGLNNAGNRVTRVGDAVDSTDAVNLGQVSAIDDRLTRENVIQSNNIANNINNISFNTQMINKGFSVGDGKTATNYNLGDTVNITAGSNTVTTNTGTGVEVSLANDISVNTVSTGVTSMTNNGLSTGSVVVNANSGLNNAGFTVSGVGNAVNKDDAVNLGQFEEALSGIQVEGIATQVTGDQNIVATTTGNNVSLALAKDINVNSVQAGDVVLSSKSGLNNAGFTVSGVGNAVNKDDAVNLGQLDAVDKRLTDKNAAQDIIINSKADTTYVDEKNAAQDKVINSKLDIKDFEVSQQAQNENLKKETNRLDAADKDLQAQVDNKVETSEFKADQARQDANIKKVSDDSQAADKDLQAQVDNKVETSEFKADQARQDALIDKKADKEFIQNTISTESARYDSALKEMSVSNSQRLSEMVDKQSMIDIAQDVRITDNSSRITDLGYKVAELDDMFSSAIASTVAFASMPSALNPGETRISGGSGYYNGAGAVAVGLTGSNEDGAYNYKIGSSYTQEGGVVVGAGVSMRVW